MNGERASPFGPTLAYRIEAYIVPPHRGAIVVPDFFARGFQGAPMPSSRLNSSLVASVLYLITSNAATGIVDFLETSNDFEPPFKTVPFFLRANAVEVLLDVETSYIIYFTKQQWDF